MKAKLLVFFLATLCGLARAAEPKIQSIEIEGNQKIETAAIRSKVISQVGQPRDLSLIQQDIRSIFGMGYFDKIEVREVDVPGGVKLRYLVLERPTIYKIEFKGNDALESDELKDLVLQKAYEVLDIQKLNQSVDKITAKYEEKGFYLATVRYEIQPEKTGEARVAFIVEENDKILVKRINIIGNKKVPTAELLDFMQTKEGGPFSFLSGSGSYRDVMLERDVQALTYYYGTQGYLKARFSKPEVQVSPDKKWITITLAVEEGDQHFVGNIDFQGDLLFTRQELMDDVKLTQGEIFNTDTLRRETLRYTEKYGDLGYAFANVIPQFNIHEDTHRVDVTFEVEKGERIFIGRIFISGNTRTKDKVIRRELKIYEGELFNGTRKRESREAVMRLGFFDSVEFHQSTSKNDPRQVDIEIRVKERSTGQLVVGAGFASGNIGFTANAQLSQNNFLGNGQVASLSATILTGRNYYDFNLAFQEPYVGYSLWSAGGKLYQVQRNVVGPVAINIFQETKTGFEAQLGHPVLEFTNLYLTYKLDNSYVPTSSIIDTSLISPSQANGVTSSATASIIYDKRDDRFDPRKGLYGSASAEYAGLFGSRYYYRTRLSGKFFYPLFWDFVFRLQAISGHIGTVGNSPIPPNELFIQGGIASLRGYDFLSVGPKVQLSTDPANLSEAARNANLAGRDITIGGQNELLLNTEIEFPLLKEAKIRGVLFVDAGNAYNGFFEGPGPALMANYGWGIRWFTPIGPLRFEFGYPIVGGTGTKFIFTIGPAF